MALIDNKRQLLTGSVASFVLAAMMYVPSAHAIVPNDNTDSDEIVDTEGDFDGVGQFFRADGSVCTGTLINPRTVLFAAHCVNDVPAEVFGTFIPAAFSFNYDAFPGLLDWFQNGFQTNADLGVFNISQIVYNPDSLVNPQAQGFIEADIALATLDTPAANIPTWALLFSALPAPDALSTTSGTGYHVEMVGFGGTGNAFQGAVEGIDFRRRAVENYLGALGSLDDRNQFLFGSPAGLPQNLYMTDFDDPNGRGFPDFNLFLDDALPNEGTTAGGDSGGPLILDAENNAITDLDVIIGVLSGGSRFLQGQPGSTYGTSSFYQPLYAFWEYIAGANPYHYVGTAEGDGNWEDASHWVSLLDPNYYIIDDSGAVVNGIPDTPEEGLGATGGDFGAVCFQPDPATPGTCQDLSSGDFFSSDQPPAAGGDANSIGVVDAALPGSVSLDVFDAALPGDSSGVIDPAEWNFDLVNTSSSTDVASGNLPDPTIDNGLPGATGFVPNNVDPDPLAGIGGSYYDVTLSQSGTTTLNSAVTIDRLTINGGASTRLNVSEGASLTSLIDVEQVAGMVNVDGTLRSIGDYLLMTGMLTGSGKIETPFLTNVMGAISPGQNLGDIATLTIDGNAVLSSASTLIIDLDTNGVSDVLAITGAASLGGQVVFNPTANVRAGNSYTFLTTGGGYTGEFSTGNISALLTPVLSYDGNVVTAVIEAGNVLDVIDASNPIQAAYGQLLDGARSVNGLGPIFASLDLLATAGDVQAVLDSWTPSTEVAGQNLAKASTDELSRLHRGRISNFGSANWGGKVTVMGNPIMLASNSDNLSGLSGATLMAAAEGNGETRQTATIPDDYEIFLAGGFMDGNSRTLTFGGSTEDVEFDGWSISSGIERRVSDKVSVGVSLNYMQSETDGNVGYETKNDYFGGAVYGQLRADNKFVLDGAVSLGSYGAQTERLVLIAPGADAQRVRSDDSSLAFTSELTVSRPMKIEQFVLAPRASLRNTVIKFDDISEEGSLVALDIDRSSFESTQARLGVQASSAEEDAVNFSVSGDFVAELANVDEEFRAGFAGVNTGGALFPLVDSDKEWFEFGVAFGFDLNGSRVSLSADTTVGRDDVEARSYRASISHKF